MLQPRVRIALSTCEALAARHSIAEQTRHSGKERPLFHAVGECPKRNSIDTLERIAFCRAIGHDTWEFRDFSNPATINFTVKFDSKRRESR